MDCLFDVSYQLSNGRVLCAELAVKQADLLSEYDLNLEIAKGICGLFHSSLACGVGVVDVINAKQYLKLAGVQRVEFSLIGLM